MSLFDATPMETERLLLRPFEPEDTAGVYWEIYSDRDVLRYYSGKQDWTPDEVRESLAYKRAHCRSSDFGTLAVLLKESRQFIGQVALGAYANRWYRFRDDPTPQYNHLEVELSFAFGKRYWGQGYAFEACQPMIRYAFQALKLRRLVGGAEGANERSARLQERLGYYVEKAADGAGYSTRLENPWL